MKQKTKKVISTPQPTAVITVINSMVAFVLAGMIVTTIHEVAHLVVAVLLGDTPVQIFPDFVNPIHNPSNGHALAILIAGPLFSLVSGVLMINFCRKRFASRDARAGFGVLLLLWLGFLSAEIGFGYLLIGPFISAGDTGQILSLLPVSAITRHVLGGIMCVLGAFGVYLYLPRQMGRVASIFATSKTRFFKITMWPFIYGTLILLAIYALTLIEVAKYSNFPLGWFALLGTATIGIFTFMADYKEQAPAAGARQLTLGVPYAGLAATVVAALAIIFGLSHGITIG